ncbi:esterase/lipase family protein [Actinomadura sp. 6N118]|uniref:esterase/lipase family protein n=1 Tax=Actinomadura sp. 6N118 TaxID=3375151 RepID=UPI00378A4056
MPPISRKVASTAIAVLAAVGTLSIPTPAQAAPSGAVYFVHGIDWNHSAAGDAQLNCESAWKAAKAALKNRGWTGSLVTWGFYAKDTRCTRKFNGNLNTRVQELGRRLAWDIHNHYTKQGKPVDVVAHSMGGVVVRAAIEGVRRYGKNADWPDKLQIKDVVTFSSPHTGTSWATSCTALRGWKQCSDLRPGSGFLKWAGQNPQAAGGTDWTLIGASDDDMITSGSATGMRAKHKSIYAAGQGLEHTTIKNKGTGNSWKSRYTNNSGETWRNRTGPGPLRLMYDALSSTAH